MGNRRTTASRSGACIQRVISAESFTGLVLGMAQTAVKPPAAAAAVPVAMVSLCGWPGSRRCTCRSMKPGATMQPFALSVSFGEAFSMPGAASSATRPSRSRTSMSRSRPLAGSMTRPPVMSNVVSVFWLVRLLHRAAFRHSREDGHAGLDSVGDLFVHAGLRAVGDFVGEFEAAHDRPGMHDDGVGLGQLHALRRDLEVRDVVFEADLPAGEALLLDAQRHDDVGALQGDIEIVAGGHAGSEGCGNVGHKIGRAAEDDFGTELARADARWSGRRGCERCRRR